MKTKIKKGRNKTLKSPNNDKQIPFVAPARKGNSRIIPWLRNPDKTIEPFKTLSLPEMVGPNKKGEGGNLDVMKIYNLSLGELYNERLHHHVGDLWDKCCSEN